MHENEKETFEIVQGAQLCLDEIDIGFRAIFRGEPRFRVVGPDIDVHTVSLYPGQTVQAGPFDMELTDVDRTGTRDIAHITLTRR